jgi:diguanylate cyclase (GGDEF)-like protein
MADRVLSLIGTKAKDLALLASKTYQITDSEAEELKKLEFSELLLHPANIRLTEMFGSGFDDSEIRYAYIMVKLDKDQTRYNVTDEYAEFFEAESGTPLDLLWLVDVVVGHTTEEILADDESYYDDIKRYSYFRPEDEKAYQEKALTYSLVKDEYGSVISGLVPFYSVEGTFVGILGVDIYIETYENEIQQTRNILSYVIFLPTAILTAAYIIIYIKNRKDIYSTVYTDPLTTIKNRRFIEKFLPMIVKEHYKKRLSLSVIMIDVDYFKLFNDTYGHQQGDEVLTKVSTAINAVSRRKWDFSCRYGGEELLVILTNTSLSGAEVVANRIQAAVNSLSIKHEKSNVSNIVTISQGVYSAIPKKADSEAEFIKQADKGLYDAKNKGRNRYVLVEE